jgi:aryl carrier-like protein
MVPAQIAIVDALPLTPNGKVNRGQLQVPDSDRSDASSYISPRNAVEKELVAIWEDLLSVTPVGVTDNFFELGGHSLLAVRMMDRIGRVLGHSLPIAVLFQTPTIDALAKHLRQAEQSPSGTVSWETVVPIQTEGDRPPIFFVHDGAGGVFHFNYLARALGDDQPFYGLQPQAWDYSRADSPTIPGLAEHYVSAIRSVQPAGPYMIGGFCFGGIVALEIAQQLRAEGFDVGILALVEPSRVRNRLAPPHLLEGAKASPPIHRNPIRRFAAKMNGKLVHKQGAELIDPAKVGTYRSPAEIAELTAIVVARSAKRAICHGFRTVGRPIPRRLRNFYFKDQVSRKAGVRYEAKPYDGEIDIFLARRHGLDWQGLARGGTAIHRIPADENGYVPDHLTMLRDPWIAYVADPLRVAIDAAIAKNAGQNH